ncbi:MAG: extracellular solute-binding protein, partial [Verrucomicrobiota bacterium]
YNKDLFSAAGIADPPKDWDTFSKDSAKLTKLSTEGAVLQSGAAMGTSANIDRSVDILSLLMMQSGAQMTDEFGAATFQDMPAGMTAVNPPALTAVRFYTDFANPTRTVYTWSPTMPNSFEAFATGKTAMMIGYNYHLPLIKARAPKLNFDVSNVPQLQEHGGINFANYWLYTVAKKSKNPDGAWSFIQFLTNPQYVGAYLKATNKPPALKALAVLDSDDPYLPFWNSQILSARSWYRGVNPVAAEDVMKTLIDTYLTGGFTDLLEPINLASEKVTQTIR